MKREKFIKPFRVQHVKHFRLKDHDPGDTRGLKSNEDAVELLERGIHQMAASRQPPPPPAPFDWTPPPLPPPLFDWMLPPPPPGGIHTGQRWKINGGGNA